MLHRHITAHEKMLLLFSIKVVNDHLLGKELFIRFTVHVFCERLSIFVYVMLSFVFFFCFKGGMWL